jgi:hypothetical protein
MSSIREMLAAHPLSPAVDRAAHAECIQACVDCAQTCTACADACLAEDHVQELRRCIRLNLDCFDVCVTTGNLLSRQTEPDWNLIRKQLEACAAACRTCGEECARHAEKHEHCRVCVDACRHCAEACDRLLRASPV